MFTSAAWFQERGAGVAPGGIAGRSFYTSLGHCIETWQVRRTSARRRCRGALTATRRTSSSWHMCWRGYSGPFSRARRRRTIRTRSSGMRVPVHEFLHSATRAARDGFWSRVDVWDNVSGRFTLSSERSGRSRYSRSAIERVNGDG